MSCKHGEELKVVFTNIFARVVGGRDPPFCSENLEQGVMSCDGFTVVSERDTLVESLISRISDLERELNSLLSRLEALERDRSNHGARRHSQWRGWCARTCQW